MSSFLIPVVAILSMFVFLPGLMVFLTLRKNRAVHEERMAMIEKGLVPPPEPGGQPLAGIAPSPKAPPHDVKAFHLGMGVGIAVAGLGFLLRDRFDLSIAGIVLTAVGVNFLIRGIAGIMQSRRQP